MMRMHLGNLARYGGVNVAKFEDGGKNNKVREVVVLLMMMMMFIEG
jgi:hypothetical protein